MMIGLRRSGSEAAIAQMLLGLATAASPLTGRLRDSMSTLEAPDAVAPRRRSSSFDGARLLRTRSLLVVPPTANDDLARSSARLAVIVVGDGDRASSISNRIARYLAWKGLRCRLFTTRPSLVPTTPSFRHRHDTSADAYESGVAYACTGGVAVVHVATSDRDWIRARADGDVERLWIDTVDPGNGAVIVVGDAPRIMVGHRDVEGAVQRVILRFVSHLTLCDKPILVSRHGESKDNLGGYIGGDSTITDRGREFAIALAGFVREREPALDGLHVWTSCLQRTIDTAALIDVPAPMRRLSCLQEIDAGVFAGMTYEQIRAVDPAAFAARKKDKLGYRYPSGESYADVIERIDQVVLDVELADHPVLIVSHKAVLRCLLGYFLGTARPDIPEMVFPSHSVLELIPTPNGVVMNTYEMGIDHVENEGTAKPAVAAADDEPMKDAEGTSG
ncbi:6-phosphofructo-2-kinase domain-containing protein [Plasmodiophora brassicae]